MKLPVGAGALALLEAGMGNKFSRKIKRNKLKKKKAEARKDIREKMKHFNNLPENCLICDEPFDKKDKEMVKKWYVVVRKEQDLVNLYCPECWNRALKNIEEIKERLNEV